MDMEYRRLGRSGLKVSVLSFGSWVTFGPQLSGTLAVDCLSAAYEAGVKIAVGTDAPAIPHGKNADELVTLVDWGLPPLAVLRAATVTAAELINVTDRGRLAPGTLADVIAVPGNPLEDITVTQKVSFVMKGGKVFVQ